MEKCTVKLNGKGDVAKVEKSTHCVKEVALKNKRGAALRPFVVP
jgi:hypothetical protein